MPAQQALLDTAYPISRPNLLDIWAADRPSRSSNLITDGPVCTVIHQVCPKLLSPSITHRKTGTNTPSLEALAPPESYFITDLPNLEGNTCVLIIVDQFFKSCKFIPLKGLLTTVETAELLFHHIFCHFGLPKEIVSDPGPQFISHVWKVFFKLLGVSVNLSSSYHPQTNGQAERKIQELRHYLWSYCSTDQHSWCRFLPWVEYAQNYWPNTLF